jgi:hypothetical protein
MLPFFEHEVLFFKLAFPFQLLNVSPYLPTGKRFPVICAVGEKFYRRQGRKLRETKFQDL